MISSGPEIVALSNVGKTFDSGTVALDGLTLDVRAGEFISLLGPSGCGKSTALRIIAGLSPPSAGTVEWPGGPAKIGFVFQEPTLMPWADVAANVRLPLRLAQADEAQSRAASELPAYSVAFSSGRTFRHGGDRCRSGSGDGTGRLDQ